MTAHQKPSFHQSLLSGFDDVGGPLVPPGYAGPLIPTLALATPHNASAVTLTTMTVRTRAQPLIPNPLFPSSLPQSNTDRRPRSLARPLLVPKPVVVRKT
jgi:hypothetical protein